MNALKELPITGSTDTIKIILKYRIDATNKMAELGKVITELRKRIQEGGVRTNLKNLTVKELRQRCASRRIPYNGKRKAELIAALRK
jgi:hypothetical protein